MIKCPDCGGYQVTCSLCKSEGWIYDCESCQDSGCKYCKPQTKKETTMKLYKKKPVVVEVFQFDGKNAGPLLDWVNKNTKGFDFNDSNTWKISHYYGELKIRTLEGEMTAVAGDYIIKGVQNEFYPCKPDIFEQTYESA